MQRLDDLSAFDWIANGRSPLPSAFDKAVGIPVSTCLPRGYPAYCKIFPAVYEDLLVTDHTIGLDEYRRRRADELRQAGYDSRDANITAGREGQALWEALRKEPEPDPTRFQRVRMQTIASRYGVPFHPSFSVESLRSAFNDRIWPRYLMGPGEGSLDYATCERLARLLEPFTDESGCFFYWWFLATTDWNGGDLLYQGRLRDILGTFSWDTVRLNPTYWWPSDRSWCVCSDYDLTFTLVAGSNELVATLIGDAVLECVRVSGDSRVDDWADQVNS